MTADGWTEEELQLADRDHELRAGLERLWQDVAAGGYPLSESDVLDVLEIILESLGEHFMDRAQSWKSGHER